MVTNEGKTFTGMVVYEAIDAVVLRNAANMTSRVEKKEIEQRRDLSTSIMPNGLLQGLQPTDLADLYAYLRSQSAPQVHAEAAGGGDQVGRSRAKRARRTGAHRAIRRHSPTGSRGTLVGMQGATPLCPPEAVSSGTVESVACPNADNVSQAPSPTCGDCKASRSGVRSPQRRFHKAVARCLPRFLIEMLSGGQGAWPP